MASPRIQRLAILALALVLTVLTLRSTMRLQVDSDLLELLPAGERGVTDMVSLARDMAAADQLVLIMSLPQGPARNIDLMDLGCQARDLLEAGDILHSVRCGWSSQDEDFLLNWILPRSILYRDDDETETLTALLSPAAVAARLAAVRRELEGVTGPISSPFLRADPLGLIPEQMQVAFQGQGRSRLISKDGRRTLLFAGLDDAETSGEQLRTLLASVSRQLSTETGQAVTLEGIGAPFYAEIYEATIRREVILTVSLSAMAVALLLMAYFGSFTLPAAVVSGVAAAVIWTGGLISMTRGHLTFISMSMTAILVGLGVDYGIHVGHDMQRLRGEGKSSRQALGDAVKIHRSAILTSAATTFVGFIVLTASSFHPLRELGMVVPLGICLVLLGFAMVTLPILLGRKRPVAAGVNTLRRWLSATLHGLVHGAQRHPVVVVILSLVITVFMIVGLGDLQFQSDFSLFRPPVPQLDARERSLRDDFSQGSGSTRVVVRGATLDEALATARQITGSLTGGVSAEGSAEPVTVLSPSQWLLGATSISTRQAELRDVLTPPTVERLRRHFDEAGLKADAFPAFFTTLEAISQDRPLQPIPPQAWPDFLDRLIQPAAGHTTVAIVLDGDGPEIEATAEQALTRVATPPSIQTELFSLPRVGRVIQETLSHELKRLMGWSLLGILLTVLISFRGRPGWSVLALLPAALGVLWLLGFCAWTGIPLNLFTVATFPVLVGIGIDDGLHVAHGARHHGSAAMAAEQRAEAMALTTLTTMIAFGSLTFSSMPAVSGGGPLIALGVGLCLMLTLTLPVALDVLIREPPGHGIEPQEPAPHLSHKSGQKSTTAVDSPHAPELGLMARLLGPLQVTGVFWYRIHGFGARACPEWLKRPLITGFTWAFFLTLVRVRRALAANLTAVLGPCSWLQRQRRAWRSMHVFAWCLTERYEALYVGPEMLFRTVGEEHWSQAATSQGGFILATAHVGNWEIGAALSPGEAKRRTHLVREEEGNPQAQDFVRNLVQERFGDQFVTHFATNDAALGLRLRGFLEEGDIVALQADRPRAGGSTVTTSLFARPFQLPRGLMALARTSNVPILPAFTLRTGRLSYDLCFSAPIIVSREGSRKESDARAAAALAEAIESAIRSHPHQWFCFRNLWPDA